MHLKKMVGAILFFFTFSLAASSTHHLQDSLAPHLLIKIPTRSRPIQFFSMLDKYYEKLSGEIPYQFLISCDLNDITMNCSEIRAHFAHYPCLNVIFSDNLTKVEAYNCGIEKYVDWFDILFMTSDDRELCVDHFDKLIVKVMNTHLPDFDGVLSFNTNGLGKTLHTLPIIGKKYYQRFGYSYHSDYHAFWCDKELTIISRMLGKEVVIDQKITHHHPIYSSVPDDSLRINSLFQNDKEIFDKRRANYFGLEENTLRENFTKDWSILICTLKEREHDFAYIYNKIKNQIKEENLEDKIEVLYFLDDREYSIGFKRNALLRQSKALYINYVDDDDDIHDNYIKMIYERLKSQPDCVSLTGIITLNHCEPKIFIHSLNYTHYFTQDNIYYRPPNHLNPIKRSIASQFLFPDQSYSEDIEWAMQIAASHLLKKEEVITEPYYFYRYIPNK